MRRTTGLVCTALLICGMAVLPLTTPTATAAAARSPSLDDLPAAFVLRGSTSAAAQDGAASDGDAPTILRGSPSSSAQPYANPFLCPPGFEYDAGIGCVPPPGPVYSPDYGWWPYDGLGFGGFDGYRRGGLRHGFARATRKGRSFRLGARNFGRFAHGFVHPIGFGHR